MISKRICGVTWRSGLHKSVLANVSWNRPLHSYEADGMNTARGEGGTLQWGERGKDFSREGGL